MNLSYKMLIIIIFTLLFVLGLAMSIKADMNQWFIDSTVLNPTNTKLKILKYMHGNQVLKIFVPDVITNYKYQEEQ